MAAALCTSASLSNYDNVLTVGSLSEGPFVPGRVRCRWAGRNKAVLKLRSNPLIFGGPVPPPYLEAVCATLDIIASPERPHAAHKLDANVHQLTEGACNWTLRCWAELVPIVSVHWSAEESTLKARKFLFEQGYYVQSVVFRRCRTGQRVLRMQVNACHAPSKSTDCCGTCRTQGRDGDARSSAGRRVCRLMQ